MRPLHLTMKGFGAFRDHTEIDFTDIDLMALVGATGSGKSTIIDAMSFALYGNVARYDDNREVAAAINQTSNEARVLFEFELAGATYTAVRVVRRRAKGATTKEARLECGEEILAAEARPMSARVTELLGLSFEQFNRTVVLPQGKFADFLHDKPADRQTILVQLLGTQLYRRIGQEARRRASRDQAQAEALAPELASGTEGLTDERRTELETRIGGIAEARSAFTSARAMVVEIDDEIRRLEVGRAALDERIECLTSIAIPPDVEEIADGFRAASDGLTTAIQLRDARGVERRMAVDALKAGPDLAEVRLALNAHAEVRRLVDEHAAVSAELEPSRTLLDEALVAAEAVRATQAELDTASANALTAERLARAARDSTSSIVQIDAWTNAYLRSTESTQAVADCTAKLAGANEASAAAEQALAGCKALETAAAERVEKLRQQHGVVGHSDLLVVGEACPLCLQAVHELPQHDVDAQLAAALADLDTDRRALDEATGVCEQQRRTLASLDSELAAAKSQTERLGSSLDGAPAQADLAGLRAQAELAATAADAAEASTLVAEAAAKAHRESPRTALALQAEINAQRKVDELTATELDLATRLSAARVVVEKGPSEEELQADHLRGGQLQVAMDQADAALEAAEQAAQSAGAIQKSAGERAEAASAELRATRERVARFGPPATDGADLSASWATLDDWAVREVATAETERGNTEARVATKTGERSTVVERVLAACEPVLTDLDPTLPLESLGELLTEARANAASDLARFDERREAMKGLQERLDGFAEGAVVAGKLGHLLRADGFENWLMEAAQAELVARATKRLFELSGGQYSLEIDKRDFAVRDHTNADELRSARTLSGGETFLASLSLALALADATADLAPEGAPQMESIFLDEGFGTLDPDTLDTVAAAIEELGASGRLVGIITHIRELADRMPVRLEVTKTGGSASVERVEV